MRTKRALPLFLPALVLVVLLVLLPAGCKDFSFFGVLGDKLGGGAALQIAPASIVLAQGATVDFSATGGTPPYSYAVVSGPGSFSANTYTASAPGTALVRVTDSKGQTSDANVTVTASGAALAISPVNVSLSLGGGLTFLASGGTPPYTFSLTGTGSAPPPIVPGIDTCAYTAGINPGSDTVRVTDSVSDWVEATIDVSAATPTVDYSVTGFAILPPGPVKGGSAIAGATFTVQNGGIADGVQDIYYWVYLSDDGTLGNGDILLDADNRSGLPMGAGANVGITGTWPLDSGPKNLVVMVSAVDDLNSANNISAAYPVTLELPNYQGTLTYDSGPGGTAGAALTATLTITNAGPGDGSEDVRWTVYASLGDLTLDAEDKIVASGDIGGGLPAAGSSGPIPINGTWPPAAGSYYLVGAIAADDEIDTTGNLPFDGPVGVAAAPAPPVDYTVTVVNSTGAGQQLAGVALAGEFYYRNNLTGDGAQPVHWIAYVSTDATLTVGTDPVIDSGDAAPLNGSTTSPLPVDFEGTWPAGSGNRYLFVVLSASDETVTGNNSGGSGAVPVVLPPVDYTVTVVNSTGAGQQLAGGGLDGEFYYRNNGTSNGVQPVHWIAYVSTDATLTVGTDPVIDSGDAAPLNGSTTSPLPVDFEGGWPAGSGDRYLFVVLSAADETVTGNNSGTSGAVSVALPPVDYQVTTVSSTGAGQQLAGVALAGEFYYRNALTSNGAQPVHWIAYVSTDATLTVGTDPVIDSGDASPLNGSTTSPLPVDFEGTWPAGSGNRYLFVVLSASDETVTGNNSGGSGAVPVALPPVDYTVTVVNSTGAGQQLAGGALDGEFYYRNNGASNGAQPVHWIAYVSTDATLTVGTDPVIDSGDAAPLNGSTTSPLPVDFEGTWPAGSGDRYLFVVLSAADETVTGNNSGTSGAVSVALPPVDYQVTMVSSTGLTRADSSLAGEFYYRNALSSNGAQPVHWIAYVSTDATLTVGTDPVIDSGDAAPLNGSTTSPLPVDFEGTWPAGRGDRYLFIVLSAADETVTGNNSGTSGAVPVGAADYSGTVTHLANTVAGASFGFSLEIDNPAGPYTLNGSQDLYWNVYASLGDAVISVDDKVVGSGFLPGGLPAGGSFDSGTLTNTWPEAAGLYFLVADIFAGDDPNTANNRPNDSVGVTAPPPPDYAVSFSTPPPWAALLGTAIAGQFRIQNISANGTKPISYAVYRSADRVISGDDVLLIAGTRAPLDSGGLVDLPVADGDLWPATAQYCFLIAMISASDDAALLNNTRASNPIVLANIIRPEEAEPYNNGDDALPFNDVSVLATPIAANVTIAITGVMDAFNLWDTYEFQMAAGATRLRIKALWDTGFDDMDLYFGANDAFASTTFYSIETDPNTEPAGGTTVFGFMSMVAGTDYQLGVNFWLANNTSGSAGKPYVLMLTSQP